MLAYGQSASMMAMAQAELEKRGLTEMEVRTRLLEEGIDVDNISPTDYAYYQDRVMNILNQMQIEKAKADTLGVYGISNASTATVMPVTTADEQSAEEQNAQNQNAQA